MLTIWVSKLGHQNILHQSCIVCDNNILGFQISKIQIDRNENYFGVSKFQTLIKYVNR